MQRKRLFIVIPGLFIGAMLLLFVVLSDFTIPYLFSLAREDIPSEQQIPNTVLLERIKDLKETKAFLATYPDARVWSDRMEHFSIGYYVDESVLNLTPTNNRIPPAIALEIRLDTSGHPQYPILWCTTDKYGQSKIENNILNNNNVIEHLDKEVCKLA